MNNHTPGPWSFDGQDIWKPADSAVNIARMIGKQSIKALARKAVRLAEGRA